MKYPIEDVSESFIVIGTPPISVRHDSDGETAAGRGITPLSRGKGPVCVFA